MNLRRITSMTMFVSLFVLIVNSIILYVVPQGRVAYWADWHLWGLSKTQWGDQHITVGFLFLVASLLHLFFNWKPIVSCLKNKARELRVFTPSFSIALILTAFFVIGTYYPIPPMSTIIEFGEKIKDKAADKYGEPPYGHAELSSLKMFTKKEGLDLEKSIQLLHDAGISFTGKEDVISAIARKNKLTPQGVYDLIKGAQKQELQSDVLQTKGRITLPDHPAPGFGKKSLAEVCTEYGLEVAEIQRGLAAAGIEAGPEMKIKEIASAHGKQPIEVYDAIYTLVME